MAQSNNPLGDSITAILNWAFSASPEEIADFNAERALSGNDRNAYEALKQTFASYGLTSFAPKIFEYVQNGYSPDTIAILLQKTPEYKKRFAANEARKKAGLPILAPQEYLATEQAYREVMKNAGLPKGFYDSQDDFTKFISNGVSPAELKTRADLAIEATEFADPTLKRELQEQGVDTGGMVAYFLDQKRALPIIQKQMQASQIGAAAARLNLKSDPKNAMKLAVQGVTTEQAQTGFGQISEFLGDAQKLAAIYGGGYDQATAEAEVFGQSGSAKKKREGLASKERATFGGSVGAARAGLAGSGGAR